MKRGIILPIFGSLSLLAVFAATCKAVTIATVPVGDPGNLPDTQLMNDGTTGYGAVPYNYRIGTFDVTYSQYAAFLNAKSSVSDPYGLYNSVMDAFSNAAWGGDLPNWHGAIFLRREGRLCEQAGCGRYLVRCNSLRQLAAKRPRQRRHGERHLYHLWWRQQFRNYHDPHRRATSDVGDCRAIPLATAERKRVVQSRVLQSNCQIVFFVSIPEQRRAVSFRAAGNANSGDFYLGNKSSGYNADGYGSESPMLAHTAAPSARSASSTWAETSISGMNL